MLLNFIEKEILKIIGLSYKVLVLHWCALEMIKYCIQVVFLIWGQQNFKLTQEQN